MGCSLVICRAGLLWESRCGTAAGSRADGRVTRTWEAGSRRVALSPGLCVVATPSPAPLAPPHTCSPPSLFRGKTNFFEKRVGDYQKNGVMAGLQGKVQNFSMDEDF